MPPKKSTVELPPKPSHVTEQQWEIAHSLPKLLEVLLTPEKNSAALPVCKQQAGLWLCQLCGKDDDTRQEAMKAGCLEVCVKLAGSADSSLAASALYTAAALIAGEGAEAAREAALSARPALLPALYAALSRASPSCVAGAARVLAVLAVAADSRLRVMQALSSWTDLAPLLAVIRLQPALPLEGGRQANCDAACVLEAVCTGPVAAPAQAGAGGKAGAKGGKDAAGSDDGSTAGAALAAAVRKQVLAAGGMQALLEVCTVHGSTAEAKCAAASALELLLRAHGREEGTKAAFAAAGGVEAVVRLTSNTALPLMARAKAAGVLLHFLNVQPTSSPSASFSRQTADAAAAPRAAATASLSTALPGGSLVGGGCISSPQLAVGMDRACSLAEAAILHGMEAAAATATWPSFPAGGMDEAAKRQLEARVAAALQAGALPPLLSLASGPDGPLPAPEPSVEPPAAHVVGHQLVDEPIAEEPSQPDEGEDGEEPPGEAAAVGGNKKKGKKKDGKKAKKGGKKAAKLAPGGAEAQSAAAGCLRVLSLVDAGRAALVGSNAARWLLPLVDGVVAEARWSVRQALLNLSSWEPPGSLAHYDAPTYLTAANLPASHMARVQLLEMPALPASTVKLLTLAHSSAKQGSGGGAAIASSGGSGGSGAAAEVAAAAAGARIAAVQRTSQTPDTMQPGSRQLSADS